MTEPAIKLSGIDKSFGPVRANRGAELLVQRGEIHALVGENGAGKSTLMRILSGLYSADAGTMEVGGRDVTGWNTRDAIAAGVGMVHQHFMLVPTLTVAENVVLGSEITNAIQLDRAAAEKAVAGLSARTGLAVPADRLVADLSVGEAQRVEILKTLYRGAKILILDEPTAVLSPPEVKELWGVLRSLKADGGTVVLITHKLDEVIEVSDAITVMRQGATVTRMASEGATPQSIARAMVGRDVALALDAEYTGSASPRGTDSAPLFEVKNLTVAGVRRRASVNGVSFSIAPGEILGIAGVEGNGQTELIEALSGLRDATGSIMLAGHELLGAGVRERGDAGLSHIPEDRHERGLILDYSIADNLILGQQHRFTSGATIDAAARGWLMLARWWRSTTSVRPTSLAAGASAVGRQPAEDRCGPRDGARVQGVACRAAHARRGCWRNRVHSCSPPRGARPGEGHLAGVGRPGRGARVGRPRGRDVRRTVRGRVAARCGVARCAGPLHDRSGARRMNRTVIEESILPPVVALLLAVVVGDALILSFGQSPGAVYRLLLEGTWGNAYGFGQVLYKTTTLVFTGLAVGLGLRAGLFNIGAESQVAAGGFCAALAGLLLPAGLPSLLTLPLFLLLAAALGGGAVGRECPASSRHGSARMR